MDFKTAFTKGIEEAEKRAGQPTPAQVLDKFVTDIGEAASGALNLQLVECPCPMALCVPSPLTDGYAVLVEQTLHDGTTRMVPVCAVTRKDYIATELRWGILLTWSRPCRDSNELVAGLQHALEDDAVASLLRGILAEPKVVKASPMEWLAASARQAGGRLRMAQ